MCTVYSCKMSNELDSGDRTYRYSRGQTTPKDLTAGLQRWSFSNEIGMQLLRTSSDGPDERVESLL